MSAFEYFKHLSKSFKYDMNRKGPRQEPWGIPHITSIFLDFLPLHWLCIVQVMVVRHASRPLSHCNQEVLQRQGHQLAMHLRQPSYANPFHTATKKCCNVRATG